VARLMWSDDFKLGHKHLDDEHRLFADLINVIYSGASFAWLRPKLNLLLDDVHHLAEQHFGHENVVLSKINRSPLLLHVDRLPFIQAVVKADIDQHIANHAEALKDLRAIISNTRRELAGLAPSLSSELGDWLTRHMKVHDAPLKAVFEQLGQDPPL
jgi:hemerythrin